MLPETNPRGSSVPTPQTDAQAAVHPDSQIQSAVAQSTPVPNCTGNTGDTTRAFLPISNPQSEIPIPQSPLPHPPSQTPLSESAALELAKLKSQLHALASPDGFAPTRDEFTRALRNASRPYCKFFKGYDQFIRACGLKSALDRRREITANQREAKWRAQEEAHHDAHPNPTPRNSEAPSPMGAGVEGGSVRADSNDNPSQPGDTPLAHSKTALQVPPSPPLNGQMHSSLHPAIQNPQSKPLPSCPSCLRGELSPKSAIRNAKPRTNEMFYGDPIHNCDMAHAPVNEQGVVLLFGMLAKKLGYRIEMVRTGYPDCEAKHKGLDNKWRRVRIEFEFVSSRFKHDPAGCDLIVCWEDDANPTKLPVLELKNHVGSEVASAEISAKEPIEPDPVRAESVRPEKDRLKQAGKKSRRQQSTRKSGRGKSTRATRSHAERSRGKATSRKTRPLR